MKEWIPLLQSLVWPLFLTGLAIWLRASIKTVLIAIADRIRSGAPFEAGPGGIKIGSVELVLDRLESKAQLPVTARAELSGLTSHDIWALSSFQKGATNILAMSPAQKVAVKTLAELGLLSIETLDDKRQVRVTKLGEQLLEAADSILD